MRSIRRPALFITAALVGTAALGYEPALLRDFSLEAQGSRLSIGAARVPLWGAAIAQTDQIVLENVTLAQAGGTYTAKRMVFSGVTSTRAEIEAIFDRNSTEPLAARLGRINARQITIPEVVSDLQVGPGRQRTTYRNLVATDVTRGRVASLAIDDAQMRTEGPNKSNSSHKRLTLTGLALSDFARVYFEKAGPQAASFTRIYDTFSMDDVRYEVDDGSVLRIARINGRDVLMRPTEESWSGSTALLAAMAEVDKPSDEETNRLAVTVADVLGAFEIGLIEMHGLDLQGKSEKGEPVSLRLARAAYAGPAGQPADMRLEGLDMGTQEGTVRLASLAFTGFSFQPTFDGIKALKGRSLEDLDAAAVRSLIPTIGTMRASGLDIDVLDQESKGPQPERHRLAVKDWEFTADKPINGIPTNIRLSTQNLTMALPATSEDEGLKNLIDLGYRNLDFSFTTAASWNEVGNEILLHEVSVSGANMLNLKASGVIGNVTRDVFHVDTALATVAALAATAKRLDVTIENTGFFERFVAQEAKKQRRTPESLRREYGSAAIVAIPPLLGNSPQAKAIGQAAARFVAKPARLRISARSKSREGFGLADAVNVTTPAEVLERLDVTATTDERL